MKKIILILLAIAVVAGAIILPKYLREYSKNVSAKSIVYIYPNTTYQEFLDTLQKNLSNPDEFAKVAAANKLEDKLKPGRYELKPQMRNVDIVRMFANGWQKPMMLTLSGNIRTLQRLSSILGKRLCADSIDFYNHLSMPEVWFNYGLDKETFLSLFIPNTYEVYWTITPEQFIGRMKKEYDKFWTSKRDSLAAELGLTRVEVSTLASIVCEETNYAPEMPTIAGVYINRLKKGMKLDADPTVKFALNDPSIKRILYKHLKVDSPYNTYIYAGLPPGPITIPSIKGLDAVLNYQKHNYLYFCANENMDGTHKFAKTLAEHNRNARAYQAALNRLKK